jgi:hypothetical protein
MQPLLAVPPKNVRRSTTRRICLSNGGDTPTFPARYFFSSSLADHEGAPRAFTPVSRDCFLRVCAATNQGYLQPLSSNAATEHAILNMENEVRAAKAQI